MKWENRDATIATLFKVLYSKKKKIRRRFSGSQDRGGPRGLSDRNRMGGRVPLRLNRTLGRERKVYIPAPKIFGEEIRSPRAKGVG